MNLQERAVNYWKQGHRVVPFYITPKKDSKKSKYSDKRPVFNDGIQGWKNWQTKEQTQEDILAS